MTAANESAMDVMWSAFWDVKHGMSISLAALKHGVNRGSLWKRCHTKDVVPRPVGRPHAFSDYDEFILATLLRGFQMFMVPLTATKILENCNTLANKRGKSVWIVVSSFLECDAWD